MRRDDGPGTWLCIECSEEVGGDFVLIATQQNLGKAGSMKLNYGGVSVTKKRRIGSGASQLARLAGGRPVHSRVGSFAMRAWWVVLSVAVSAACAARTTPTAVTSVAWLAVDTPHIHLETNLSPRYATLRARTLERELLAQLHLYRLLSPRPAPDLQPIQVILFDDCESFETVGAGKDVAGYARRSHDLDESTLIVTCDDVVTAAQYAEQFRNKLFRHELAHVVNQHFFGDLPQWLNEGIAEYFEAGRARGDKVELGHPPFASFRRDRAHERTISFDELRAYTWVRRGEGPYHAAWKAVYAMLNASMISRDHTMRYLSELARGASQAEAWERAMQPVAAQVRAAYAGWKPLAKYNIWTVEVPAAPDFAVTARTMTPVEVAARVVELAIPSSDDQTVTPSLRDALDNLRRLDATGAQISLWTALAAYYTKNPTLGDPLALFDAHLAVAPDDPRAHLGRFLVAYSRIWDAAPEVRRQGLAELAPTIARLVPVARTSYAMNALARYQIATGNLAAAVPFLRRGLERDPGCSPCYETFAYLLFINREFPDAVRAQQLAIGALGDAQPRPDMLTRLEEYRAALPAQP